jgi:hypothetical protein
MKTGRCLRTDPFLFVFLFLRDFVGLRDFPVASATEPLSRGEGFGERVT